jgi:hypothetical protein
MTRDNSINTEKTEDENNINNREFGIEITNVNKKNKKIKYPKQNNIFLYPKSGAIDYNKRYVKKKYPSKKCGNITKSKVNEIIKKINGINIINDEKEEKNEIREYKEDPIEEYEKEIISNLFQNENKNRADYSKFPTEKNNNKLIISFSKRFSFINLLISYQLEFHFKQETFYLAINLFDRYIQKITSKKQKKEDLNIIALTCLYIALKYEEIDPPYLKAVLELFTISYLPQQIILKEDEILSSLDFQVLTISPLLFLKLVFKNNNYEKGYYQYEMDLCFYGALFILDLCMIEPKFCELKPSLQAALSLYVVRKILYSGYTHRVNIWDCNLYLKTNYLEKDIKPHLKIALNTIKKYFGNEYTKNFKAMPLYLKYSNIEYLSISCKLEKIILRKK